MTTTQNEKFRAHKSTTFARLALMQSLIQTRIMTK